MKLNQQDAADACDQLAARLRERAAEAQPALAAPKRKPAKKK